MTEAITMTNVFVLSDAWDFMQFSPVGVDLVDFALLASGRRKVEGPEITFPKPPIRIEAGRAMDGTLGGGVPTDCVSFTIGCLLLSDAAVTALHRFLAPAGLLLETVQEDLSMNFTIFLCTNEVDALDRTRSVVHEIPGAKIFHVQRYAFHPELVRRHHVFRLPYSNVIHVSEAVVQAIRDADLTGFWIDKVWDEVEGGPDRGRLPSRPRLRGDAELDAIRAKLARQRERLRAAGYPMHELTGALDLDR